MRFEQFVLLIVSFIVFLLGTVFNILVLVFCLSYFSLKQME